MSNQIKAPEQVPDAVVATGVRGEVVGVAVTPTQVRRPWRSTVRTVFQVVIALATLIPFIVAGVYDGSGDYPAVIAQVLAAATAVTRVMALPQVEVFLRRFLPWLAAAPSPKD